MMSIHKKRREADRNKKLEEQFVKADTNSNGKIRPEQMIKIFEANEVSVTNLHEEVRKLSGKDGWITVNEFIKFSQPTDLCKSDFTPFTGYTWDKDGKQVKSSTSSSTNTKHEAKKKTKASSTSNSSATKMDQVEQAFKKFDLDNDGFLSREEFDQLMSSVGKEQAERIFKKCDASGDNQVSLEEFRTMVGKKDNTK